MKRCLVFIINFIKMGSVTQSSVPPTGYYPLNESFNNVHNLANNIPEHNIGTGVKYSDRALRALAKTSDD